jgi:hypothetical protein
METTSTRAPTTHASATNTTHVEMEDGDFIGPDLAKAQPIADVIRELAPLRNGYSADFLAACEASGIGVTVRRNRDGVDGLEFGLPMDGQERLREERLDALVAQMKRGKSRRQQVIDHLNLVGKFLDAQPFASAEELAQAYLAVGGRMWIHPCGRLGEALPWHGETPMEEWLNAYPLRRLNQRYSTTMILRGSKDELSAYIREHGKLHPGSGFIVLEGERPADA